MVEIRWLQRNTRPRTNRSNFCAALLWMRSTTSAVLRRSKCQGGEMWRLSGWKKAADVPFYSSMFDGIPDMKRWSRQQRAKAEYLMFWRCRITPSNCYTLIHMDAFHYARSDFTQRLLVRLWIMTQKNNNYLHPETRGKNSAPVSFNVFNSPTWHIQQFKTISFFFLYVFIIEAFA